VASVNSPAANKSAAVAVATGKQYRQTGVFFHALSRSLSLLFFHSLSLSSFLRCFFFSSLLSYSLFSRFALELICRKQPSHPSLFEVQINNTNALLTHITLTSILLFPLSLFLCICPAMFFLVSLWGTQHKSRVPKTHHTVLSVPSRPTYTSHTSRSSLKSVQPYTSNERAQNLPPSLQSPFFF